MHERPSSKGTRSLKWLGALLGVVLAAVTVSATATAAPSQPSPTVTGVSPGYGPQSGGTFTNVATSSVNPDGTVTVSGTGLGGATAVVFDMSTGKATVPVSAGQVNSAGTQITGIIPPRDPTNEGVSVQVVTPQGTSAANCTVIQTGCQDAYAYFKYTSVPSQSVGLGLLSNQTYSAAVSVSSNGTKGGTVQECGSNSPPSPAPSGTASAMFGSTAGTTLTANGTLDQSDNASLPSAFLGNLTLTLNQPVQVTVSVSGSSGDCIDIPTPLNFLGIGGLYLVLEPTFSGSLSSKFTIAAGTYTIGETGWVNGHLMPPVLTMQCPGVSACLQGSAPNWNAQANLIAGLMFRIGPSLGSEGVYVEAGPAVGLAAGTGSAGSFAEACAGGIWDGHVNLTVGGAGINLGANGPLVGPYQLAAAGSGASQQCPLGPVPDAVSVQLGSPQVSGATATINGVTLTSTPGASITGISWNWGDGTTSNSWFPASHLYAKAGTYTVTVTATDSNGNKSSATTQVTIPSGP
jgi:hypothetical protein